MEENNIADGSVETPSVEELQERLKKAEAKIVEMKKSSEQKSEETPSNKQEEEKVDLDKKINELLEAKLKSLNEEKEADKYEVNQDKTNSMSMAWEEHIWWNWFKWISLSEFDKMSPIQKREYIQSSTSTNWEVVFI